MCLCVGGDGYFMVDGGFFYFCYGINVGVFYVYVGVVVGIDDLCCLC